MWKEARTVLSFYKKKTMIQVSNKGRVWSVYHEGQSEFYNLQVFHDVNNIGDIHVLILLLKATKKPADKM